MSGLTGVGARPDHDLHVLIERDEKLHQAFNRELVKAVVSQGGDFGLRYAEQGANLALFQLARLEQIIHGQRQAGLGLQLSGIGKAQIGEDVGGSAGDPGPGLPLLS